MTRAEATEWLTRIVSTGTPPVLTAEDISRAIDASRVVDSEGRAPVDDGYVETISADHAAALLFDLKATLATVSKVAGVASFTSEGSSVTRTAGVTAADFQALAAQYRAKLAPGVSVIDLGPALGPVPRSAYEGVTPDDHRW